VTFPSAVEFRALLADLEPGPSTLLAVGGALLLMLMVGLLVLLRGRRRRRVAARRESERRAARAAAVPRDRRAPGIRRSTPTPLFAGRDEPADMLTSTLGQATDALGVLGALEAADRAEPAEPDPPLPRWLAAEPEVAPPVVAEVAVTELVLAAPLTVPDAPTPSASVRSVAPGHVQRPRADRAGVPPWMVVAGLAAVLLLRRRREPPRGA
jgi:hypothetical protein